MNMVKLVLSREGGRGGRGRYGEGVRGVERGSFSFIFYFSGNLT